MISVMLVGNVGKPPETRYTQSGMAVARFSVASNTGFGEKKKTSWVNCVAFGKTAEYVEKYIKGGNKVAVKGEMENNKYEKEGVEKDYWQLTAQSIENLTPREEPLPKEFKEDIPERLEQMNTDIPF